MIGILIWILFAVIGVLILANSANNAARISSYGYGASDINAIIAGGGIAAAITVWISGFLLGLSVFSVGEIIRLLAVKATTKYMLTGDLSALMPQPAVMQAPPVQNMQPMQGAPQVQQAGPMEPQREPVRFSWRPAAGTTMICPVCGCQQEALRPVCQQCGVQFLYPEN